MPQETYYGAALEMGAPTDEPYLVTPDDDEDLPQGKPNYLFVGVAGDVEMVFNKVGESSITLTLAEGYHLFRPDRIRAAGTTAEQIVACYDRE